MTFVPLWQRLEPREDYSGPFEGLPEWMKPGLDEWFRIHLTENAVRAWEQVSRERSPAQTYIVSTTANRALNDPRYAFALIDFLISFQGDGSMPAHVKQIAALLVRSGSVWAVAERDGGGWMLERREQVDTSAAVADLRAPNVKIGDLLETARAALFGLHVDADAAYDAVVKAVEIAMHPVVTPKDDLATLGKMNKAIRDADGAKFAFSLDGAKGDLPAKDVVLPLSDAVWTTQRRHGTDQRDPVTHEQAHAAYLAGVSLCGWFLSGAVRNTKQT